MADSFKNYYKTLGITREASAKELQDAYRQKAREFHPDMNSGLTEDQKKKRAEKLVAVYEAYEALGRDQNIDGKRDKYNVIYDREEARRAIINAEGNGQHTTAQHNHPERDANKPASESQWKFKLAENDIGLLLALIEAYKAKGEGVWEVLKSEKDTRDWIPIRIYQVKREADGAVKVSRIIKDWRSEIDRDKDVSYKQERNSFELEDKKLSPNILLGEYWLFGEGSRRVVGLVRPNNYDIFIGGIKQLAHTLAKGPDAEGKYDISRELIQSVNLYADSFPARIRTEGQRSSSKDDRELGRTIPFEEFWNVLGENQQYIREVTNWRYEGQAKPPKNEGRHPRPSGETR